MDCRTALEILDCVEIPDRDRIGAAHLPAMDLAAAEAHLTECRRCAAIVENRRRLDRKIGHAVRAVNLPRGGRERLLAQLAALETPGEPVEVTDGNFARAAMPSVVADNLDLAGANSQSMPARQTRRRPRWLWRSTVPVAACLLVAAIGFFSVIWLMTPRWSVDDVRLEVAKINFSSFDALRDYNGETLASRIPRDPGWQKLDWRDHQTAKGLPTTANPHQFALFAFAIPGRQRRSIEGLLAVVPRHRMRAPPAARSLSEAHPSDYLPAQIGEGEAVSVAWTDGDVVYVCLVEGGADSLDKLKQLLGAPAA